MHPYRFMSGRLIGVFAAAVFWLTAVWMPATPAQAGDKADTAFRDERLKMVAGQIKARGISDPAVLRAMETVPRHLFVPVAMRAMAYQDTPLPIGHRQTISQPYIVALMTTVLETEPGGKVLEVGTGSGYQAAVLAEMGARVYSIEIIPELGRQARKALAEAGYDDVHLKVGDGYKGWPQHAPFDAIIVTCAPTQIPLPLEQQLAEGGRMVIPVGDYGVQELVLLTKRDGMIRKKKIVDVRFVPMVDEQGETY